MHFVAAAKLARRYLPEPLRYSLERTAQQVNRSMPGSRVRWGNIRARAPFSDFWGWDRGRPVDRYYIEEFLAANAYRITGAVLEVQSALYGDRFGDASRVTVLDIDRANARADLIADLNQRGSVPEAAFDCVILTQVLQYTEPVTALRNIGHSLRPGGYALVTVPCLSRVDPENPADDLWRWTPQGLRRTIELAGLSATVVGRGNSLAAAAYLLGLAAEEVGLARLDLDDESYPVVACAVIGHAG